MYDARFPVLQQYEENMWFDATGRRIAKAHQQYGYGQPKDAWKQLSKPEAFPEEYAVPDGYTDPLYRANRKAEVQAAHAGLIRRPAHTRALPSEWNRQGSRDRTRVRRSAPRRPARRTPPTRHATP